MVGFPNTVLLSSKIHVAVQTPYCTQHGLGSFHFARRYFGNRCFFLFLRLLRCFSSAGIPLLYYFIHIAVTGYEPSRVSTFGNLRVKRIFAPNRSLSQLIASFVGTWCQGIRPVLLLACPNRIIWVYHVLSTNLLLLLVFYLNNQKRLLSFQSSSFF